MSYSYEIVNKGVDYKKKPFACTKCQCTCYSAPYQILNGNGKVTNESNNKYCFLCVTVEVNRLNTGLQKLRKDDNYNKTAKF